MSSKVHLDIEEVVATITLGAPVSRNALTPQMLCMLAATSEGHALGRIL